MKWQPQQYLIIAKINSRYRIMAVVSREKGILNEHPRACWRLLQILGHPANKKLLAHERNYAATFTESLWDDMTTNLGECDGTKIIPFPFTTTCLALAVGFDRRPGTTYCHTIYALPTRFDSTKIWI